MIIRKFARAFSTGAGMRPIYLDAQSTTPLDPRVLDTMLPYMTNLYGNPHSKTHSYGWETESAVEEAREQVVRRAANFFFFFSFSFFFSFFTLLVLGRSDWGFSQGDCVYVGCDREQQPGGEGCG